MSSKWQACSKQQQAPISGREKDVDADRILVLKELYYKKPKPQTCVLWHFSASSSHPQTTVTLTIAVFLGKRISFNMP